MTDIMLSEHFMLSEFLRSATAQRLSIDNTPDAVAVQNLTLLCRYVLEPLRQAYRRPIIINSGYRCRALNRAVGGAARSYHLSGRAADIRAANAADNQRLYQLILDLKLPHAELIRERPRGGQPTWIHVAI